MSSRPARLASFLARPPLALTLLVCAVILCVRRPELIRTPQFWAEDGLFFFFQAWEHGLSILWRPYAGYLHTTQRIVAAATVQLDPAWAPACFVAAALGLTLYVAARTQSSRFPFRPHVAYALAVVLVPDTFEVLLFLVNIQWVLACGLLLLLISAEARSRLQHIHDAIAATLLGLTGPFSILFLPLFVWRAVHRRTPASWMLAAIVFVCAAIQAWTIWKNPVGMEPHPVVLERTLAVPGMRVTASLFAGTFVPNDYPLAVETGLGLLTLLAVGFFATRPGAARLERLWLALAFLALLAASLYRCRYVLPDLCHAVFGSRYFYAPQLVFLWLAITLTADARRGLVRGAAAALVWIAAVNLPRLHEGALVDLHWAEHAAKLRHGEAATVPINPVGWSFTATARPQ